MYEFHHAGELAKKILVDLGYADSELPEIDVVDHGTTLPSVFRVDEFASAIVAATHAANAIERGLGRVCVDSRHAAISFRSERYLRVDGAFPGEIWAPLSGDYRSADGRWIRLHCNFEHHAQAALRALGCKNDRNDVNAAVARIDAFELEDVVMAEGGAAAAERTHAEWMAHPQSAAIAAQPLVQIERIGDAAVSLRSSKVLEFTRVLAGPVAGRTLAAYGADVQWFGAPHLPQIPAAAIDTGIGKRIGSVDLREEIERDRLRVLVRDADIFLESYRPGAFEGLGFGARDVATMRPGIIYASVSAYGTDGAWGGRRGFDSLVQMATGITREAAVMTQSEKPVPLPAQALDHGTGWLTALGVLVARARKRREGGSWHVRTSLARTAQFLQSLGLHDTMAAPDPTIESVRDLLVTEQTPQGVVTRVRFPA